MKDENDNVRQQTERGKGMKQEKIKQRQTYDYVYLIVRAAVLLSVIFLFIPSLNPARISSMINKNLSLFTSASPMVR